MPRGEIPPRWTGEQLELQRRVSITAFRGERMEESTGSYLDSFEAARRAVEELLATTADLTDVSGEARKRLLSDASQLDAMRYAAGPPISADDLKTLADASLAPARLARDAEMAHRVIETILLALDRKRFPWVADGRSPKSNEREAAVLASAALIATQRLATERRSTGKNRQERAVADALSEEGLERVAARSIPTLGEAPGAGQFCPESRLGSRKADFVVGLWDGRTMAIECKVSNSSTNSVKRLNNDAAVKAKRWTAEFGTLQVVPAAVLAGVFKRHNLEDAQNDGLTIFWAHDLASMAAWISRTRP